MSVREAQDKPRRGWGCCLVLGLGLLTYLVLRAPRHFDPETWRTTDEADRVAMARNFSAREEWRGKSHAEIAAWLGEPGGGLAHTTWPLPDEWLPLAWPDGIEASGVTDRPRIRAHCGNWGVRLDLEDSSVRGTYWNPAFRPCDPDGLDWSKLAESPVACLLLQIFAQGGRRASEEVADLAWYAGQTAFLHAALLYVRFVDDRAVSAWLELR
jgi:hypothetical protein